MFRSSIVILQDLPEQCEFIQDGVNNDHDHVTRTQMTYDDTAVVQHLSDGVFRPSGACLHGGCSRMVGRDCRREINSSAILEPRAPFLAEPQMWPLQPVTPERKRGRHSAPNVSKSGDHDH